jgi:hypothetical protein
MAYQCLHLSLKTTSSSQRVVSRPTMKIEKGVASAPSYVPPSAVQQETLEFNAQALQNHEVVLIMGNNYKEGECLAEIH